jgi:hypothetical protein
MESDLSTALMAARAAGTRQSAQIAIVKKNHEMDLALVEMVAELVRSAPPPGQGKSVDKLA